MKEFRVTREELYRLTVKPDDEPALEWYHRHLPEKAFKFSQALKQMGYVLVVTDTATSPASLEYHPQALPFWLRQAVPKFVHIKSDGTEIVIYDNTEGTTMEDKITASNVEATTLKKPSSKTVELYVHSQAIQKLGYEKPAVSYHLVDNFGGDDKKRDHVQVNLGDAGITLSIHEVSYKDKDRFMVMGSTISDTEQTLEIGPKVKLHKTLKAAIKYAKRRLVKQQRKFDKRERKNAKKAALV